jgi:hypothetical protein
LEAPLQGVELVKRAWHGIDFHSFQRPSLSIHDRVSSFLTGILLLIPVVNTVIWIAWKTFGNPKLLIDPFTPEIEVRSPPQTAPVEEEAPAPGSSLALKYKENEDEVQWIKEEAGDQTVIKVRSPKYQSNSTYNADWRVQEYHYREKEGVKFDAILLNENEVSIAVNGEKPIIIKKEKPLPWIQQPTVGFRDFILSDKQETGFYSVVPELPKILRYLPFLAKPPYLMEIAARKVGFEEFPSGKVVKMEIQSTWGLPYSASKFYFWYDPADGKIPGVLRKFEDPGLFFKRTGIFVQNNLWPELEHP